MPRPAPSATSRAHIRGCTRRAAGSADADRRPSWKRRPHERSATSPGWWRRRACPSDRTIDAVRILRSAVHGFVQLEAAGGFGLPDDVDASFERLLAVLWAGFATLRDAAPE